MATERSAELDCKGLSKEDYIQRLIERSHDFLDSDYHPDEWDFNKGTALLKEALDWGSMEAAYLLGIEYLYAGKPYGDIEKAFEYLQISVDSGDDRTKYDVSQHLFTSKKPGSYAKALSYLRQITNKYTDWGSVCNLIGKIFWEGGYGETQNTYDAVLFFKLGASRGNISCCTFLANIYETGHKSYNDDNVCIEEIKLDPNKAYKFYSLGADHGDTSCKLKVAQMKIRGYGTAQDYRNAFFLLWEVALSKLDTNYLALSEFYVSGYLFPKDYISALFWAYFSQNAKHDESTCHYIKGLMEHIDGADIIECQLEVKKFANDLNLVVAGHSSLIMPPEEYYEKHGYRKAKPKPAQPQGKENLATLSQWNVKDASQLTIILNYSDKVITAVFRYQDKKLSFPIQAVFSQTYQQILVEHHRYLKGKRSPIEYRGKGDFCKNGKNKNHYYIEHFNSHLRKLLGADASFLPFEWLGPRKSSSKGLKMHFNLEVFKP